MIMIGESFIYIRTQVTDGCTSPLSVTFDILWKLQRDSPVIPNALRIGALIQFSRMVVEKPLYDSVEATTSQATPLGT